MTKENPRKSLQLRPTGTWKGRGAPGFQQSCDCLKLCSNTRNTSLRTATPRIWFLPQFQTIRLQSACGRCRNTPSLKKRGHQISSSLKQPFGVPKLLDDTGSPAPLCQAGVALLDNGYVGYLSIFVGSCPKRNTNESIVLVFKWQTNFNVDVLWNGKTT